MCCVVPFRSLDTKAAEGPGAAGSTQAAGQAVAGLCVKEEGV